MRFAFDQVPPAGAQGRAADVHAQRPGGDLTRYAEEDAKTTRGEPEDAPRDEEDRRNQEDPRPLLDDDRRIKRAPTF